MSTTDHRFLCRCPFAIVAILASITLSACAAAVARAGAVPGSGFGSDGPIDLLSPQSAAEGWQPGFHRPGFDSVINAMAIYEGNLYVGGSFNYAGDLYVGHLARWDGVAWTGVPIAGSLVNVYDLTVHDGYLVVGGEFTFADGNGATCREVARYDGTNWHAMGAGFSGRVRGLNVGPQGQLIAVGEFTYSGSSAVRYVAYWSNATGQWLPFASGVSGAVYAVTNHGGQIVIGGIFTSDNLGTSLGRIARWTGTAWRGIFADSATSVRNVYCLEVHEGNLYAGGNFGAIEGAPISGLAVWDGLAWSAVPWFPGAIDVSMLRSTPSALVASGSYTSGGAPWDSVDDGIMTRFSDMLLYGDDWFVSGYFKVIGDAVSPYLAILDGDRLTPAPGLGSGAGLDGTVLALLAHGSEIVASGSFTTAGTSIASGLAAWNGSEWRQVGGGLSAGPWALASYGQDLVVGGNILNAGGTPVNRIALWNGLEWQALGSGLNGAPYAMVQYGDDLVAAGSFTLAGGTTVANIARWDGSQWHAMGSGLNSMARALLVHDGLLIVGGTFTTAGGAQALRLAAWDGTGWSEFGGGADGDVYALAELAGNLVVGGYFGQVGGVAASRVARLRNGQWEPLGTGFVGEYCWTDPGGLQCQPLGVEKMAASGGELYVSGTVNQAGAVAFTGVARWDEWNHWMAMDTGISSMTIPVLAALDGALFVGGGFATAGGTVSANLAQWNEPAALPLEADRWWGGFDGNGPSGSAYCFGTYGDNLVVAGMYDRLGLQVAGSIATWDGGAWNTLAGGLAPAGSNLPQIHATLEYQGDLYAAGMFAVPPATETCDLARWDGASWEALGFPGDLTRGRALALFDGRLIVGGSFQTMGGQPMPYIAAWDGTSFSALGSGLNGTVLALAIHDGKLVVGGSFTNAGGLTVQNLALWDGTAWEAPPPGFTANNAVYALLSHVPDLYVGGDFDFVGSVPAPRVARWDGSAFHPLGAGMAGGSVYSLSWLGDRLVAGGGFTAAGGIPANYLVTWDGAAWSSLGGGMNGGVWGTCAWNGDFYAGGGFSTAGGKNSPRIARWVLSPTGVDAQPPAAAVRLEAVYPNPFNPFTRVRFSLAHAGPVTVTIHDLRGRAIRTLAAQEFAAGEHALVWNGRDSGGQLVGSGVYFVRVRAAGEAVVRKITLLK